MDEMLSLTFQYLAMLRASVLLPRWVFDECAAIGEMATARLRLRARVRAS